MSNYPLKLRLRIPIACPEEGYYIATVSPACAEDQTVMAILEFQNPLNGSWHPVEVYEETEKQKPA